MADSTHTSIRNLFSKRFELTRRATIIARALAILIIMLHNLVHIFPTIINEAEFNYYPALNVYFFRHLNSGNPLIFYDFLSFLGWYGVPVFMFLSGFGLAKRYDPDPGFSAGGFIWRNWRKLFFLMLPAVMVFVCEDIIHSLYVGKGIDYHRLMCELIPLTELNGIFQDIFPVVPGVYWYLGLSFELYIIYALTVRRKPAWILWSLTIICYLIVSYLVMPSRVLPMADLVYYLRHNFVGWMLPFAFGITFGRRKSVPLVMVVVAFILSILLFFPLLKSPFGWQVAAIAAICIIVGIAAILDKTPGLSTIFTWVGTISAYLYIVHPIVRHLLGSTLFDFHSKGVTPNWIIMSVYVVVTFIGAIIYRPVAKYLTKHITRAVSGVYERRLAKFISKYVVSPYEKYIGSYISDYYTGLFGTEDSGPAKKLLRSVAQKKLKAMIEEDHDPDSPYPAISIIVPVYNAEKWLREALDSISAQTFHDFEVILINDGSTDLSESICREYCNSDMRFRLAVQNNRGVAEARNLGLELARGKWIAFMDADDLMPADALELMINYARSTKADIIAGAFSRGMPDYVPYGKGKVSILKSEKAICDGLYQRRRLNNPWGMLFRSTVFSGKAEEDTLRFRNCRYEDLDIFYRAFERVERIAVIDRIIYYYRDNPGSFINNWSEARLDVLDVTERIVNHFQGANPKLRRAARSRRFSAACNMLAELIRYRVSSPENIRLCMDIIRTSRADELKDNKVRLKNKFGAILSYPALPVISAIYRL